MGVISVTSSYSYSALCDRCKFKYKASQLKQTWNGLQVCKECWEPRHPSDFYRARNDQHKLPWTRSDDGAQGSSTWTPVWTTLTLVSGPTTGMNLPVAVTTPDGDYNDWITGSGAVADTRRFLIQIIVPRGATWTTSNPLTVTLPSSPVTAGTFTFTQDEGTRIIATGTVPAGSTTLTLLTVAAQTFFNSARVVGRFGLV